MRTGSRSQTATSNDERDPSLPATPEEIFERTEKEGRRRLSADPLAQISTGFLAGFNIVFALVALGIVYALTEAEFGADVAHLASALAFGFGLTFIVVGRSELFTENFLGPVTAKRSGVDRFWMRLGRLWSLTLLFNLIGGIVLALILTTEGALPEGTPQALVEVAQKIEARDAWPDFMNAIAGGALVTLLSWLVLSVGSDIARIAVTWVVGTLLALGPFNHVVVTTLQLFFGLRYDAAYGFDGLAEAAAIGVAGNLLGGLVFVTMMRLGQARG